VVNAGTPLRAAWLWGYCLRRAADDAASEEEASVQSALFIAVRLCDPDLLRDLLHQHGGDVNANDGYETLLSAVAGIGDVGLLKRLLECPDLDINAPLLQDGVVPGDFFQGGHSAPKRMVLHLQHAPEFLRLLLQYSTIDVNKRDGWGARGVGGGGSIAVWFLTAFY